MNHVEDNLKKFLQLFEELKQGLDCDISWASKKSLIGKYSASIWCAFEYEAPCTYIEKYRELNDQQFVEQWLQATEIAAKDVRTILNRLECSIDSKVVYEGRIVFEKPCDIDCNCPECIGF